MFFKSQVACLRKLTHVYAGKHLCLFFRQLPFWHEGNEGNCSHRFKSARLHTSRHIAGLISIYITNLKSYLGSKNNCLQLPANSQKPRCAYVIARAILVFKLPANRRQLPAN